MKQIIAWMLVCALALLLVGCGSDDSGYTFDEAALDHLVSDYGFQWTDPDAPILNDQGAQDLTFHIYSSKNASALDYNDMKIMKDLFEQTNVTVDWENVSESVYSQQKNLIFGNVNDRPDAIYHAGMSAGEIMKYAKRGVFVPISDYLEYMPNLAKILEERPDIKAQLTNPEDGRYYVVVGNRVPGGSGTILLYQSKDAVHGEFVSELTRCERQDSRIWECPDFFSLDGRYVLLVSPQDMVAGGREFHPGNSTLCILGGFDPADHRFVKEQAQAIDYGLDFYAPQTLQTADGRRVMIGWMQNWETSGHVPEGQHFMGQMTIPRELSIRDGRLCQNPVRELEQIRGKKVVCQDVRISGPTALEGVGGRFLDLTVTIRPEEGEALYRGFEIELARDEKHSTTVRFTPADNLVRMDRTRCGVHWDIVNLREFPVRSTGGALKLRMILDRYSLEVFVNDGEQAASSILYTPLEAQQIRFCCDGVARMDLEQYDLEAE